MPKTILGMTFVDRIFRFYLLMRQEYSSLDEYILLSDKCFRCLLYTMLIVIYIMIKMLFIATEKNLFQLRIILTSVNESLGRTRYFILSLQPYSTMLWLFRSPKVCAGIRLNPLKPCCAPDGNTFAFQAMPVCTSWSETVVHDKAGFLEKPDDIRILDIFYSLLVGTVKHSR